MKKYLICSVKINNNNDKKIELVVSKNMKSAINEVLCKDRIVTSINEVDFDLEIEDFGWRKL